MYYRVWLARTLLLNVTLLIRWHGDDERGDENDDEVQRRGGGKQEEAGKLLKKRQRRGGREAAETSAQVNLYFIAPQPCAATLTLPLSCPRRHSTLHRESWEFLNPSLAH